MDDIVLNKVATLERCVARVREVFAEDERNLRENLIRQDSLLRRHLDDLLAFGRVALATEGRPGPARN